jgi:hypothetical protein
LAGVWNDPLQRPVDRSHIFNIPSKSLEIAIPPSACRLTDSIEVEADGMDSGSLTTRPVGEVPIFQRLTDLSLDAEVREEKGENVREVMLSVCSVKVFCILGPSAEASITFKVSKAPKVAGSAQKHAFESQVPTSQK